MSVLDVTLNLNIGTHENCNKRNKNHLHINVNSNHPPKITKNLPENIQKRISKLSSSTRIFNNSKDLYNKALFASGFQQRIKFEEGSRVMSRILTFLSWLSLQSDIIVASILSQQCNQKIFTIFYLKKNH